MTKLDLTVALDNSAWRTETGELSVELVGDALRDVAKALWSGCTEGRIIDINGNPSGEWSITE